MLKKIVLSFCIFAFVASAATYRVKLSQPATVKGQEIKAGEYTLKVDDTKVTLTGEKGTVELPAKLESVGEKYQNTSIRYEGTEKPQITEIRLGGTKTKVVINN